MDVRSETQIREELTAEFLARTGLRGLRAGDEVAQVLGMMARQVAGFERANWERRDQHLVGTASGDYLRALLADALPDGLLPEEPQYGLGGAVVFYRPTADPGALTIPSGTTVYRSNDSFAYRIVATATILGGNTVSGSVSAIAQETGAAGNCDVGDIDRMDEIAGVTSVRNTAAITNGSDGEEDDEARDTLRRWFRSVARTTRDAILRAVFAVNDPTYGRVMFAKLSAAEATSNGGFVRCYIDDGAGTAGQYTDPGEEYLIQNAAGGEWLFNTAQRPIYDPGGGITVKLNGVAELAGRYGIIPAWGQIRRAESDGLADGDDLSVVGHRYRTGLSALAQVAIDGVLEDVWNQPPVRGCGGIIEVVPATRKTATILCPVSTVSTAALERTAVLQAALRNLLAYVNGRDIGEPLLQSACISALMNTSGVKDVPWLMVNGTYVNLFCLESEAIRTSEPSVTFL